MFGKLACLRQRDQLLLARAKKNRLLQNGLGDTKKQKLVKSWGGDIQKARKMVDFSISTSQKA